MATISRPAAAPDAARRDVLMERVTTAAGLAAGDRAARIALDEQLQELREESARTMALIRDLRTSPLYRLRYRKSALQSTFAADR